MEIGDGKIDVVVYKVDRLTRSLTDFAKLADLFNKHGASCVSITQFFNTTSSITGYEVKFWRCPVRSLAMEFHSQPATTYAYDHGLPRTKAPVGALCWDMAGVGR